MALRFSQAESNVSLESLETKLDCQSNELPNHVPLTEANGGGGGRGCCRRQHIGPQSDWIKTSPLSLSPFPPPLSFSY